jgi:hypothetical protein
MKQPSKKFILRKKNLKAEGYVYEPRKYVSQVLNLCSSNSQATRPKKVGQMSEIVEESGARTQKEWSQWYLKTHPHNIDKAVDTIQVMLNDIVSSAQKITRNEIKDWVEDLILYKTFYGIRIQESILRETASLIGAKTYRLAIPSEEAKGIDGFLDKKPVQIKPVAYKQKSALPEKISVPIIYYKKEDSDFEIDISEII